MSRRAFRCWVSHRPVAVCDASSVRGGERERVEEGAGVALPPVGVADAVWVGLGVSVLGTEGCRRLKFATSLDGESVAAVPQPSRNAPSTARSLPESSPASCSSCR